jgi:hypothetical protein
MPTNLPRTIPELLIWGDTHSELWQTNQPQIGLSAAQVTAFKTIVGSARSLANAADEARLASKNATEALHISLDNLRATGGAFVNLIKAYAETTNNMNVYTLAGVSPDDPAGTVPPPNTAESFTANVNPDGSLAIKWRASQPQGVTGVQYLVSRRVGAANSFTLVGTVGSIKTFIDTTLPFGVDNVQYIVQPKRGDTFGPQSQVFALQFGSVGGGFNITAAQNGTIGLAA